MFEGRKPRLTTFSTSSPVSLTIKNPSPSLELLLETSVYTNYVTKGDCTFGLWLDKEELADSKVYSTGE